MQQQLNFGPQFLPRSIARAIWKRKWSVAAVAILGSAAVLAVVLRLAPVYTASAVILVESQKIPENFVAATVQTALEAQLDTLKQQVLSSERLWSLIEDFQLYSQQRAKLTRDEVLRLMKRDISISLSRGWSARGPGAFQVEFQANQPDLAANVANQIGSFFINENLRQRTAEAAATSKFLDGQMAAAEIRLRDQETRLKEFKLSHNGELPEQEGALLASVAQSRTELLGIQESMGRAQQNKVILESSLAYTKASLRERQERLKAARAAQTNSREVSRVPAAPASPTPLELAEAEVARLRARYRDPHPEVQRALSEAGRLRREVADTRPETPSQEAVVEARGPESTPLAADESAATDSNRVQELTGQISAVAQEIQTLEQRKQRLLNEVADAQARIRNLPVREQQLAVITRDYETSKSNYQSLLSKKLAADVATDMERWHRSQKFVMLDPARPPERATRPKRLILISAGSTFSILLGLALAVLRESRKNVLLGSWELPNNVAILARVPSLTLPTP